MQGTAKVPNKVARALEVIEKYYDGAVDWLAKLYDKESGGFYMAISGKEDPCMEPAIEMTCWGVNFLKTYTRAFDDMPDKFRTGIIEFMNSRQDKETGLYIDRQGVPNSREVARNQAAALRALGHFNAQTRYPHPTGTGAACEAMALMPQYMSCREAYVDWIGSMDWDNNSWTAGDQAQSSLQYVNMLEPREREEYKAALFDWLERRQFDSGFFSPNIDFNAASGAFKVGLIYLMCGRVLPNYDSIIDSIFQCYKVSSPRNPYFVRNPLSTLAQIKDYSPQACQKIRERVEENIDAILKGFGDFLCPDGGFCAERGKSMVSFGGVVGSHGLFEGDIDATLMMLTARRAIYNIFDEEPKPLDTAHFWQDIYGG